LDSLFFLGLCWYIVFLFSTTAHEAAHAWVALKLGDDTAYQGGQVSLDPTPHVRREPWGMVVVPIASFLLGGWMIGWASAPYDPEWAQRYPKRSALMACAGPLVNLCLVITAALALRLGVEAGLFHAPSLAKMTRIAVADEEGWRDLAAILLSLVFSLNLLLFIFNLLPLPPLDGASLPLFFMNEKEAEAYAQFIRHPGLAFIGLFLAWKGFHFVYEPAQTFALNILYAGITHY
jgi:Zn-dependent protease